MDCIRRASARSESFVTALHVDGQYGFGSHPDKPEEIATLARMRQLPQRRVDALPHLQDSGRGRVEATQGGEVGTERSGDNSGTDSFSIKLVLRREQCSSRVSPECICNS